VTLTNTGCETLTWSVGNPMSFVTLDVTGGTLAPGASVTLHPTFPCSGYAVGANVGNLTFTVRSAGTLANSTGAAQTSVSLTVH
jgi:hypothetical protein